MPPPPQDYTQDAARRVQAREHALLGLPVRLADEDGEFGPALLPFTPWHHFILNGLENPLVGMGRGGRVPFSATMEVLWVCSPRFSMRAGFCSTWNKAWFAFRAKRLAKQARRTERALGHYLAFAFIDRPPLVVGEARSAPRAGLPDEPLDLVRLELVCRRELRYTRAEFWHTPYAHTMQLLSVLRAANNPGDVKFDETARQVRDIFAARRANATAGAKGEN